MIYFLPPGTTYLIVFHVVARPAMQARKVTQATPQCQSSDTNVGQSASYHGVVRLVQFLEDSSPLRAGPDSGNLVLGVHLHVVQPSHVDENAAFNVAVARLIRVTATTHSKGAASRPTDLNNHGNIFRCTHVNYAGRLKCLLLLGPEQRLCPTVVCAV